MMPEEITHNPYLAQILLRCLGPIGQPCEAAQHREKPPLASWEARFYQNTDRLKDLLVAQEQSPERVDQTIWDEACREQDSIGVRVHRRMALCDACATRIANGHAADIISQISVLVARSTKGALLLVSERSTEKAAIVGNLPGTVLEKDLLDILRSKISMDFRRADEEGTIE